MTPEEETFTEKKENAGLGHPEKVGLPNQAENEKKKRNYKVPIRELFRFADKKDWLLMSIGAIAAGLGGLSGPIFSLVLGDLFNDFNTTDDILATGAKFGLIYGYIAIALAVTSFFQVSMFTISSERQVQRFRRAFLEAALAQEISWFDVSRGELTSSAAEHATAVRDGIGEKLGHLIYNLTTALGGLIVGFIVNWTMTLVIFSVAPLLALAAYLTSRYQSTDVHGSAQAYSCAGGIAEEAISMIRTVACFGLETRLSAKYEQALQGAESAGIRMAKLQALGTAFKFGLYFLAYALAFWYGSTLVESSATTAANQVPPPNTTAYLFCDINQTVTAVQAAALGCPNVNLESSFTFATWADVCACSGCMCGCTVTQDCVTGGEVITVFFAIVMGAFALGVMAPYVAAFEKGRRAAAQIFAVVDRVPLIDSAEKQGQVLQNVNGDLRFDRVSFAYPSRKKNLIFKRLSIDFEKGKTTALVGGSGCGKSTITQLLLRFYDPDEGRVLLDGVDIRDLKLEWFRGLVGLVGQEPVLFATSIAENIALGAPEGRKPTREEIYQAAKAANAYNFIQEFPEGFDTQCGGRGVQLSGGQRQRIAIARAIIRDPTILLLDEATSALDNESEKVVQQALDDLVASKKRTTVVIAHRLSTVRGADKIIVLGVAGVVLESGSHDELMHLRDGHYLALVQAAEQSQERADDELELDDELGDFGPTDGPTNGIQNESAATLAWTNPKDRSGRHREPSVDSLIDSNIHLSQRMGSLSESALRLSRESSSALTSKSTHSELESEKEQTEERDKVEPTSVPLSRILAYSKQERLLYIPAVFGAGLGGVLLPIFSLVFTGISTVFYLPTQEQMEAQVRLYCFYVIGFALALAIAYLLDIYSFGIIGERMTLRLRVDLFRAVLRQEIGFFDIRENSVGALTGKLASDSALVKAGVADKLGLTIRNICIVVTGLVIAFVFSWQVALVMLAIIPLLVLVGILTSIATSRLAKEDDQALGDASQVLSESVGGIRTVAAFNMRSRVVGLYDEYLQVPVRLGSKKGIVSGIGFGLSNGLIFASYAIAFYFGSVLIYRGLLTFSELTTVFFSMSFMAFGLGQSASLAPDVGRASNAIRNVFSLLDRPSVIDPLDPRGSKDEAATNRGEIRLECVSFAYPTRVNARIFRRLSIVVEEGSTVALVGQSGSGKSTLIGLAERFYDPQLGKVRVFGVNVKDANVSWLRSRISIVSQEPQLFNGSIAENIAYGLGADDIATQDQIEAAAKAANAHGFISQLPDGYATLVSSSNLSGGQKQRVAIARAIVSPKRDILLLDEATSALDNESERVVQEALDALNGESGGRRRYTKIVVAHRLSTVRNADKIYVFDHGKVVESGTHQELMRLEGTYAKLYRAQEA